MSVGRRLKHLLDSHGHSLRKAQEVTGVCHETIRRIINGWEGPTLIHYVRQIAGGYRAQGYQVDEKALMEGMDPRGDFEWTIRQAPPVQRLELALMSIQDRVRLALDFLKAKYPSVCRHEVLATASGLQRDELESLLCRWGRRPPDLVTALALATAVSHLTGLPKKWLVAGWLQTEQVEDPFADRICRVFAKAQGSGRCAADRIPRLLEILRRKVAG